MPLNPSTLDVPGLARAIVELDLLPPLTVARRARELAAEARTVLAARADAAIVAALEGATYEGVAAELGLSTSAVNKAVTRHRTASVPRVD